MVPSDASETRSPLLPSNLYFIIVLLSFALRRVPQLFSDKHLETGSRTEGDRSLIGWIDAFPLLANDLAVQEWIPLFAIYNLLSKRPSSKTVEAVRCRHFSASLARAASACCTRFSASTPRISRTGTSSLFASCRITSAIFRGSPSNGRRGLATSSGTNRPRPHT